MSADDGRSLGRSSSAPPNATPLAHEISDGLEDTKPRASLHGMPRWTGIQDADPVGVDTARVFRLPRAQRLVGVTLPGAFPYIATGLRISSSVALQLAVVAELVIGMQGLGQTIGVAGESGAAKLMYALIVVTGFVGWVLNSAFARVERRVLHWHASMRPVEVLQ